jgi:hypothetical protein
MRNLLSYPDDERRATTAGINLFFSALLGANLGAMNAMPLAEYFQLVLMLVGAVTGILTIAVSKRPVIIWTTAAALVLILGLVALIPDFGPAGVEAELDRLAVTLGVWAAMLVLLRLTPSSDGALGAAKDDEVEL